MPTPAETANFPRVNFEIDTPALLVDLDRMESNLSRASRYAAAHGLALRPHVKTHKSPRIAALQMAAGAVGVTCATPHEAHVMSEVTSDILLAYPPVGRRRAARIASLPSGAKVTVALDSPEAISTMAQAAEHARRTVGVYVELDFGMHRVGVPVVEQAVALARQVAAQPSLHFSGIAFYPGHVREDVDAQDATLGRLGDDLTRALAAFTAAGVRPPVVSGGSTPTLWRTHDIEGVTEMRPGTYVYNDRTTAAIGACAWDDCAATVLATVISTAVPGQAVIDAGTKALGREPVRGAEGEGFGQLLGHDDVIVSRMSEEHGVLDLSRTSWKPEIGEQVRVIPNHVCIVVHLNDVVHGIRDGVLETTWPVSARGRG